MRLMISLFALALMAGVAAAEPHRGGHWSERSHAQPRSHDTHVRSVPGLDHGARQTSPAYGHSHRVPPSRRYADDGGPQRAHLRGHYDHAHRPALLPENHTHLAGYVWIAGQWAWNGYEWIWQPGRYEVDPSYTPSGAYQYNPY